jgi:hypothetical protein
MSSRTPTATTVQQGMLTRQVGGRAGQLWIRFVGNLEVKDPAQSGMIVLLRIRFRRLDQVIGVGPASDGDLTGHGIRDVLANFGLDTETTTKVKTSSGRFWHTEGVGYGVRDVEYVEITGRSTSKINLSLGSGGDIGVEDYIGGSPGVNVGVKVEYHLRRLRNRSSTKYVSRAAADQPVFTAPKTALRLFDWNASLDEIRSGKWVVSTNHGPFLQWA